ncbi:riboflavin biosynthesis protein RibA [Mycobacterium nebraskense]|uniref:3,4-dihydroxy-2-butanone-4-phosphate synthase n=1 Tax=Mycobacterium nebraskense TaxID=244292 RepID=UPI0006421889|nr:3,4-dihydroxy-2-butanone-4-phosphate synthase [Mycobacterium nebraskense]KLO39755.1 riboflavin biosynthesis protein RibA [Mycobacterium nebraskense]
MKTTDVRVRRAVAAMAAGRPVVLTEDTERDCDGLLVFAADRATPKLLAFTIRHTSGYVRVALPPAECERLNLPPMCHSGDGKFGATAHRVSVDYRGSGTGISATDRARTIAALASADSAAADFLRPGHVVPAQAGVGGVLGHRGPNEAAIDLARLAGRRPAAALCEIVSRDRPTAMARRGELVEFAVAHRLPIVSIGELVAYRRRIEPQVVRLAETMLPMRGGDSRVIGFQNVHDDGEHLAVIIGAVGPGVPVPLHVHVECLTGDVFGSTACRCGEELESALTTMRAHGSGVIVYLRSAGAVRGCRLGESDAVTADLTSDTVAWILRDLGVYTICLSDDAPGFGLVMFGAIREYGLRIAG